MSEQAVATQDMETRQVQPCANPVPLYSLHVLGTQGSDDKSKVEDGRVTRGRHT